MNKYDVFLFDADDTLFDFSKSSALALETLFNRFGYAYSEAIPQILTDISAPLWQSYEKGKILDKELQKIRFVELFAQLEIQHDPGTFNDLYLYELGKNSVLIDDALEVCKKITECHKQLYIITNGFAISQESRLKHSPVGKHVSGSFISEVVGHKKPSREYFKHVLSRIPDVKKKKTLVVGDSLSADIAGGAAAGIDTCWFNRHGVENTTYVVPTYEVRELRELEKFI